jgi:hypothetical protein
VSGPDYARGFRAGYAEYLFSGTTAPPPLAPAAYRTFGCQTPEGYRAMEEWFAGYNHGVAVAVASGYRRWITCPVSPPHSPPVVIGAKRPDPPTASPAQPLVKRPEFGAPTVVDGEGNPPPAADSLAAPTNADLRKPMSDTPAAAAANNDAVRPADVTLPQPGLGVLAPLPRGTLLRPTIEVDGPQPESKEPKPPAADTDP